MAFALNISLCGTCDELEFIDDTGLFSVDNPGGYNSGAPNTPDGPSDFDTYVLSLWAPGADLNGDPTYTLDLLANLPNPDSDFDFTWTITASDIGVLVILSGIWTAQVNASFGQVSYTGDVQNLIRGDIQNKIDAEIFKGGPPKGGCTKPCMQKALDLQDLLCAADSAAGCGKTEYAQDLINYLYRNYSKCCS